MASRRKLVLAAVVLILCTVCLWVVYHAPKKPKKEESLLTDLEDADEGDVIEVKVEVKVEAEVLLVKQCMLATHLDTVLNSSDIVSQSIRNTKYFVNEFRKAIPQESLDKYQSHCWRQSYSIQWTPFIYKGHIGNLSYKRKFEKKRKHKLKSPSLMSIKAKRYESDLACLPNFFLAGFPKCGSTFLFCLINKLISHVLFNDTSIHLVAEKEPHFWAKANAAQYFTVPSVEEIGDYMLNFLPGLVHIDSFSQHRGILIDGTPNTMFNWPRFRKTEHDLTNYCLLPATLPILLPNSKFVVIMRNPVKMLYSAFWFSCTTLRTNFSRDLLLKGPSLFHERVMSKIHTFSNCMTDTSVPSISHVCELDSSDSYDLCIRERLHLLDKCTHEITFNLFSQELAHCGRSRVAMGMYYVHIRKWLSVVSKDRFLFLTLEELIEKPTQTVHEMVKFLGLRGNIDSSTVDSIAQSCNENSQSTVNYKHDPRLQMRMDTKLLLERFYHTFNSLLAEKLDNDKFLWHG